MLFFWGTITQIKSWKALVTQSCPTLRNLMDCSPPGSSVHEISEARILEWVAVSFSWEYSWPRDQTQVSCIAGGFFTIWVIREAIILYIYIYICMYVYIYIYSLPFESLSPTNFSDLNKKLKIIKQKRLLHAHIIIYIFFSSIMN